MTRILTRMAIKTKEQIRVNLENTKSPSLDKPLDLLFNICFLFIYHTENKGRCLLPLFSHNFFSCLKDLAAVQRYALEFDGLDQNLRFENGGA